MLLVFLLFLIFFFFFNLAVSKPFFILFIYVLFPCICSRPMEEDAPVRYTLLFCFSPVLMIFLFADFGLLYL